MYMSWPAIFAKLLKGDCLMSPVSPIMEQKRLGHLLSSFSREQSRNLKMYLAYLPLSCR